MNFFILQYSLPIALVVLGSLTTSQEKIKLFLTDKTESRIVYAQNDSPNNSQEKAISQTDSIVSRIIFLLGIISILLGVTNSTKLIRI